MPAGTGAALAHEMGHNLGFYHDNDLGCTPCNDDRTGYCIMDSQIRLVL